MPRYAHFDPRAAQPAPVLGWYDTDAVHYPDLPASSALVLMTDAQWQARLSGRFAVQDAKLVAWEAPAPPARPWEVSRLVVVERLAQAGRLREAAAALKLGVPDAELTDRELLLRMRWEAARTLASDDADVRGLLTAIGADANAVLAPPGTPG